MPLQAVTTVKGHAVSDDGGQVAVAFATKDGGELSIMLAVDCLEFPFRLSIAPDRPQETNRSTNLNRSALQSQKRGW